MTITEPRGAGGSGRGVPFRSPDGTTRSARNRVRRRANGSSEARPAVEELSPPRRRTGPRALAGVDAAPAVMGGPSAGVGGPPAGMGGPPAGMGGAPAGMGVPTGGREAPPRPAHHPAPSVAAAAMPLQAGAREAFFAGDVLDEPYPEERRRRGSRRAHARPGFLGPALVRCCLYVGPLSVAVVAGPLLSVVAWPVPAVMLLLGWGGAQAFTSVGVTVARRSGAAVAARVVFTGFLAMIGIWCSLVWIAPSELLGPNRALAAAIGIFGLLTFGSVTSALVTRSEGVIAAWFGPCWLLAIGATVSGDALGLPAQTLLPAETMLPAETLLPAAIVAVAVRAFRPAALTTRRARLTGRDRWRGLSYSVVGASQAICVILLWHHGPAVTTLPVLLAIPLLEAIIGWHIQRIDAGLDSAETAGELGRHVRGITAITLAALWPPLAIGGGLAFTAYELPGIRDSVLALAAGTLLGGVFAVTSLLAARSRTGIAATLAAVPPLAAAVITIFGSPGGPLPAAVAVLASVHLAGLLIVALTAADLRRTP